MKKTIITVGVLFLSFVAFAQNTDKDNGKDTNLNKDHKWEVIASFGSIKFNNTSTVDVKDNINVGLTLGLARQFQNNLFVDAGATFSSGKELENLFENVINYFSVNANVGYKIQTGGLSEAYIAGGGSFINAINTLPNAESSFSGNITGGFIFWLRDSKWGVTIQDTYKFVNSDYMVSHNQITIGVRYKL